MSAKLVWPLLVGLVWESESIVSSHHFTVFPLAIEDWDRATKYSKSTSFTQCGVECINKLELDGSCNGFRFESETGVCTLAKVNILFNPTEAAELAFSKVGCCDLVRVTAASVLGQDLSGLYSWAGTGPSSPIAKAGKPTYRNGDFCLVFAGTHWKIDMCSHPAAVMDLAVGFVKTSGPVHPHCPTDVGAKWSYYNQGFTDWQEDIAVECADADHKWPGLAYSPQQGTIDVLMPRDPLHTLFDYPLTIWRGESFYPYSVPRGDVGWVSFHLVYANGSSHLFFITKEKDLDKTYVETGLGWSLCSSCSLSGGVDQVCMKHETTMWYDMHAGQFRPAGNPNILFKGVFTDPSGRVEGLGSVIYSCRTIGGLPCTIPDSGFCE